MCYTLSDIKYVDNIRLKALLEPDMKKTGEIINDIHIQFNIQSR